MTTVLVTGGAGFIGSNFVRHLYAKYPDYRLIVVDSLTYAGDVENLPVEGWRENNDRFAFWYGSVSNGELMDALVSQSDIVVHLAAETHVTRSIYDNTRFFATDVLGTQMVCNAACKYRNRVKRLIHVSSSEVYGTAVTETMTEEHPLQPRSPYAAAKAGADRLVFSYWVAYGLPAVIVRPFNNYGPRQHLEKVVPRFITGVILGETLRVHGTGEAARDFVHVRDTCEALDLLMHAPEEDVLGNVYNVGTGEHRTILSLARDVARLTGYGTERVALVGDRPGQVLRHTADTTRIHKTVGWEPRIAWEEGLAETIQWYRENEAWWTKQLWMREVPIITPSGKRELH